MNLNEIFHLTTDPRGIASWGGMKDTVLKSYDLGLSPTLAMWG